MAAVTVRPVGRGEEELADALGEITADAYRGLAPHAPPTDYLDRLARVTERFEDGVEVLVALDPDDVLLGGVTFVGHHTAAQAEFDDPDTAGFRHLAVAPDAQGRGIGRLLAQACIDRARDLGRRRVLIHLQDTNDGAAVLYASMGFRRAPEHDFRPRPTVMLLALARTLDGPAPRPR